MMTNAMKRKPKPDNRKRLFLILLLLLVAVALGLVPGGAAERTVYTLKATGSVNPGLAEFITQGIEAAEQAQAEALVIQLDTPGGLDTSMRQIVQDIVNAKLPVIVYVSPPGGRAASAGLMITLAAHVAAMAPGTNLGAAHPVSLGAGKMDKVMGDKVVNDMVAYVRSLADSRGRNADWAEKAVRKSVSIPAAEAVKLKVVDLMADSLPDLLHKLQGRVVKVGQGSRPLQTAGARVVDLPEGLRVSILKRIADPNIAFVLMMIGLAGLYFELAHPGAILPGVLGAMSLLLALYAFQALPVNFIGVLLMALAFIFFILEIYVTSFGLLTVAGVASLLMGAMMLFRGAGAAMGVAWSVLLPTVLIISLFFITIGALAVRAQLKRPLTGMAGLVGERGTAATALTPAGRVFVHGEYWQARSLTPIPAGEPVEVVAVEGLKLLVRPPASENVP